MPQIITASTPFWVIHSQPDFHLFLWLFQIKLKLEISQRCAYRVYDDFSLNQITQDEQGNFIIEVKYPYNDWIYSFLLSYGDQLKVLEPQFIQDELVQRLQKNLKIYLK